MDENFDSSAGNQFNFMRVNSMWLNKLVDLYENHQREY